MPSHNTLSRIGEALQRVRQHWEERSKSSARSSSAEPSFPTIAITREAGAEVPEVVRKLGEELGWPVYDKEILEQIAEERGIRVDLLESIDERYVTWMEECLSGLSGNPNYTGSAYAKHLFEVLHSLASLGQCIIVGRGAAQALPRKSTLRIRFVAPRNERIARVMHRQQLSEKEAKAWVDKTQKDRDTFIRQYAHRDPNDPSHYDLTLDVTRWDSESLVKLTVMAVKLAIIG